VLWSRTVARRFSFSDRQLVLSAHENRVILGDPIAVLLEPGPLAVLPPNPTQGDLDAAYATRGAQIVNCDGARRLAVETQRAEHQLIDEWLKLEERRRQGWLRRIRPN